jgi:hypothetical protein
VKGTRNSKATGRGPVSGKVRKEEEKNNKEKEKRTITNRCCPWLRYQANKDEAKKSKAPAKGEVSGKKKENKR